MDYRNNKYSDSWDDGVFGTGKTEPPKSHSGIIALLLILVIFLSGIVSLLSFMNIKLFHQLSEQSKQLENKSPMGVTDMGIQPMSEDAMPEDVFSSQHIQEDVSLELNRSPQSVENIPTPDALSWQEIYEKNNPCVVSIYSTTKTGDLSGSGVILSPHGYVVTTCHMVVDAETITVTLYNGETYSALVVGADALTDLALLYMDAEDLPSAEFGDSDALRVGDSVAAMGGQMNGSLNDGIISAINRDVPFLGQNLVLIQSNVLLNPGSAGGPLINCYGQVVGIHTTRLGTGEAAESTGFAIPSTTVKQIVDQLIAQGYVSGRPTLGLSGESITKFDRYYFHIPEGLYLTGVDEHSDAFLQGIAPGDILISLEGQVITTQNQLDVIVNGFAIGDTLTAVIYRNSQEETITLTVTEYVG